MNALSRTLSRAVWAACLVALCLTAQAADPAPAAAADIKVGFAERDITPDIGMEQPGGYGKAYHKSVHDPCKVRAVVFDDGRQRLALVGIDALVIRRPQVLAVRQAVAEKTGIRPAAVLIAASHSHSSGPTGMILPGEYDHASALVQDLAYNQSSTADAGYLKRVTAALIEAIVAADQRRAAAKCGFGSGTEATVAFNRRFKMKDHITFTHPGQGNPDIVEPAGPIDPEVGVVAVWDKQTGEMTGCVVNFACHATTSPGGASANYIYYLEKTIQSVLGQQVHVVFLNGPSGDVTQVNNLSPYKHPSGDQWARLVGGRVGAEAVKVVLGMTPGGEVPLAAAAEVLKIQRRRPSPEHVDAARRIVQAGNQRVPGWVWAKETVLLDAKLQKEPVAEAEIQAIQVGPAVFVTTPAEYFCRYGLEIKQASKFPYTYPVSLANGCVGYVPTTEALADGGGGYETRLTSYSNLHVSAGDQMRDKGIELAGRMTPGPVFTPPPAAAFGGHGWSYGNVPPQRD